MRMKPLDPQTYAQGVLSGDRRMLSKAITLIESALPTHQQAAGCMLKVLMPSTGRAVRLGITGVPGVGKSTFIESLGMMLVTAGHRVAVLAVDPSSARSGGSVMADKTRMEKLATRREAFIRPSPSGGTLGGVARKTRESMLVCEAAGFDVIIVETVGVGQSETTVASMVDFFLLLLLAGAGDELQGIKKGILELADAVAVNKADGDNLRPAQKAAKVFEIALHLVQPSSPSWTPPVLTCSAREMTGIESIWKTVLKHREIFQQSGELEQKRRQQAVDWMWSLVDEGLKERFARHPEVRKHLPGIGRYVKLGRFGAAAAAEKLLFFLDNNTTG
jgi:LAO/AO transport system kinase